MNISEKRAQIKRARIKILEIVPKLSEEIAVSTLSMVKNRSIEEGISVDGKEGDKKDYSTKDVYTSSFKKKALNNAGRSYISANKKGTWGGFRQAQGLRSGKVNLSYTNRMWTSIQVIGGSPVSEGKYQSIIGSLDDETRSKISQNVKRYGSFLTPTEDEILLAQDVVRAKLIEIVERS